MVVKFYRPERWSRAGDPRRAPLPAGSARRRDPGLRTARASRRRHRRTSIAGICYGVWPRTGGRAPDELSDDELRRSRAPARAHPQRRRATAAGRPPAARRRHRTRSIRSTKCSTAPGCRRRARSATRTAVESLADVYAERLEGVPRAPHPRRLSPRQSAARREGWFFLDFDDFVARPRRPRRLGAGARPRRARRAPARAC